MPEEPKPNPDDSREGESGGQQGKQFASMDDALKYIEALEKRVTERTEQSKSRGDELQQLRDELKELQAFRQQALEQQGNYQALAEERGKKIAELQREAELRKKYEALVQTQVDAQIAQLPEDSRDVLVEGLTLDQQLTILNKIVPKLTKPPAPDFDAGAGGTQTGQTVQLTSEQKATAKRFNMSEKEFAEQLAKVPQDNK